MDKKYCTNCGTENVSNASFCISCGSGFETKPVEETVVEAPTVTEQPVEVASVPTVEETPEVTTDMPTQVVTPEPPKKKKKKGGLIALIVILLIAGIIVGGIFLYKKLTYFEDPFVEDPVVDSITQKSFEEQLNEDLANGKLTVDEYVMQLAYALYEPDKVLENYTGSDSIEFTDVYESLEKYGENLSYETVLYIYKKYNLSDYIWATSDDETYKNNNEANVYNASVKYMTDKPDGNVKHLNGVILSKNKHFLVYYSTEGRYPTSKSQAKKVANYMENVVDTYESEYNLSFKYELNYNTGMDNALTKPYSYNAVVKLLEENNIDTKYLDIAMPVYIIDNESEKTNHSGFYIGVSDNIFTRLSFATGPFITYSAEENVNYTTYAFPYFGLSSSLVGTDDQYLVAAHELFHHYQHYICGNGSYGYCASGQFTTETTASEAALRAYKSGGKYTMLNGHSGFFLQNMNDGNGLDVFAKYGDSGGGYSAYVFASAFEDVVPNGYKVMFDSMKSTDAFQYIYNNSNGKYGDALMKTAERYVTLDFENKALLPLDQISHEQVKPKNHYNISGISGVQSEYINISNFNYFSIRTYNYPEKTQLCFSRAFKDDDELYLLVFVRDGNKFKKVYKHHLDEEFVMNIDDFRYYDEISFMVVNTSISKNILYSFQLVKDGTKKPTITAKSLNLKEPKANKKKKQVTTSRIVCSQVEDVEYIKSTYQVMVEFGHNDDIKDMYVKGTVEMEEDNAAFKIAKGITTGAIFLLKQKYKEEFGKITLRTYDEGNKYIILGRVKKDFDTAARNSFGTNDLTREGIFKAIEDKGFTCEYR
jgi:hypothetical protein